MYTKQDLIENKKMGEIIKANKIKMREEFIKKNKHYKQQIIVQSFLLSLLFLATVIIIGLVEKMTF